LAHSVEIQFSKIMSGFGESGNGPTPTADGIRRE
jgi:hypothetical protein